MVKKRVSKELLLMALPVIFQMTAEYFLRMTDTAFIGHYDPRGLSAVSNVMIPFIMFLSFFFALSKGTTIMIAHNLGAGNRREAERQAETSYFYNYLISILYFVFWLFFASPILHITGAEGEIFSMALSYVRIAMFQFLFLGITLSNRAVFEGMGKTLPIFISSLSSVLLNIVLDWLLIFGRLGFPELGIRGAALATLISQIFGTLLLFGMLLGVKDFTIRIKRIFKPRFSVYLKALKMGFPTGLEFIVWCFGQFCLISMINRFDSTGMAAGAFYVFTMLISLSAYIYLGLGVASMTLVGKAIGSKNWDLTSKIASRSTLYSLAICVITAALFSLFPRQILAFFVKPGESYLIEQHWNLMFLVAVLIFPKAVNIIIGHSIRGTGNTRWMLYTQIPGTISLVVISYFLIFHFQLGLASLLIAMMTDELWRSAINFLKFQLTLKKNRRETALAAG